MGFTSNAFFCVFCSIVEHDVTDVKCKHKDIDPEDDQSSLTLSDELFAVLVTLKLGFFREEVADCFAISLKRFDQTFHIWISCLFAKIPEWRSLCSGLIDNAAPCIIQNTSNLKVVLCWFKLTFEMDSERSTEKTLKTFKILTGLNPHGNIIFSSGIWVQKAEGSMVAMDSGILDLIEDGDTVIVPSDIDIGPIVQSRNVKTISLPYDKEEVFVMADEQTQSIYNFINRSIDRLKVFGIMNGIISAELVEESHKIVAVCSQICNIYHSL